MQEENIFELIDGKKYARLRELLSEMNPADIAQICEDIPERELPVIFRILPKELAAEVFVEAQDRAARQGVRAGRAGRSGRHYCGL